MEYLTEISVSWTVTNKNLDLLQDVEIVIVVVKSQKFNMSAVPMVFHIITPVSLNVT